MRALCVMALSFVLMACTEEQGQVFNAVEIADGDECHVCGMLINRLPGPKAQAVFDKKHIKFCSTRDMVSFFQEEENTHRVSQIFVHNMHENNWAKPSANTYIDGKGAWYVTGSSQKGAMGPTFASFESQQQAQSFAAEFGGQVQAFDALGDAHEHTGHSMSHSQMKHHNHH